MMCIAFGTPPPMSAVFALLQNFITVGTIPSTVRTFFIQCVPCCASGAIPGMRARLSDVDDILAGRAIPAVRCGRGANVIRRMVRCLRRAVPVMDTVFVRR